MFTEALTIEAVVCQAAIKKGLYRSVPFDVRLLFQKDKDIAGVDCTVCNVALGYFISTSSC